MKRLSVLIALAIACLIGAAGVAYGNMAIHGCYLMETDACAGCHRAHTAASPITWEDGFGNLKSALLIGTAQTIEEFCLTCHGTGAPGAATNVQDGVLENAPGSYIGVGEVLNGGGFDFLGADSTVTSKHTVNGSAWPAWGGGVNGYATSAIGGVRLAMDCAKCHDPHGSSNYRILNDKVNTYDVGGYDAAAGFPWDSVNPKPTPFVISVEPGYPRSDNGYTYQSVSYDGFLLHTSYPSYVPMYTRPYYSVPAGGLGADPTKGMSGWCIACHTQYMTTEGNTSYSGGGVGKTGAGNTQLTVAAVATDSTITVADANAWTNTAGTTLIGAQVQIGSVSVNPTTYELRTVTGISGTQISLDQPLQFDHGIGDYVYAPYAAADMDNLAYVRHRHAINVPLDFFSGDRDLNIANLSLPVAYLDNATGTVEGEDWMECLTCHRAHGTDRTMTGYANTNWVINPVTGKPEPGEPDLGSGGVAPANSSALLRMNNRGVCEDCHNK